MGVFPFIKVSNAVFASVVFCVFSYVVYQFAPAHATQIAVITAVFLSSSNLFTALKSSAVLPLITVVISAAFTHLSVNHLVMLSAVAVGVMSVDANVESIVVGGVHFSSPYTYLFTIAFCSLVLSAIHLSGTHQRTLAALPTPTHHAIGKIGIVLKTFSQIFST